MADVSLDHRRVSLHLAGISKSASRVRHLSPLENGDGRMGDGHRRSETNRKNKNWASSLMRGRLSRD